MGIKKKSLLLIALVLLLGFVLAADTTAPVTTSDANASWNTERTITFECNDDNTGCMNVHATVGSNTNIFYYPNSYNLTNSVAYFGVSNTMGGIPKIEYIAQVFYTNGTVLTDLNFKKGSNIGSPTGDINISIVNTVLHSGYNTPSDTILFETTIPKATWDAYPVGTEINILLNNLSVTKDSYYAILFEPVSPTMSATNLYSIQSRFNGSGGSDTDFYKLGGLWVWNISYEFWDSYIGSETFDINGMDAYFNILERNQLSLPDGNNLISYYSTDFSGNNESLITAYHALYTPELVPPIPTITVTDTNLFDSNITANLNCVDNMYGNLTYDINLVSTSTNVNILHQVDANNSTKSISYAIPSLGEYYFIGQCTDQSGNSALENSSHFYSISLALVNEKTGALLTSNEIDNNFRIANVYSIDGNYSYNFKDHNTVNVTGVFSTINKLVFNYGYDDADLTELNRFINVSMATDYNIRVCAPLIQTFYEQEFLSSQQKGLIVYNAASNCYNTMYYLHFAGQTSYSLMTTTIKMPYLVYTYLNNVRTTFADLDGGNSLSYNIDVILFTRNQATYSPSQDWVGVTPFINPLTNKADLNIMTIQYKSFDSNNTSTTLNIYNNSTLIYSYTESSTPNEFTLNWNYSTIPGLADINTLKLVATANNPIGNKTTTIYFNIKGVVNKPMLVPELAAILSVLFFTFGITVASTGRTFGLFGILICLACIAMLGFTTWYWWIQLLMVAYAMVIIFILLVGKPTEERAWLR